MAHKKAGGSTRLGRDSKAKRLGVKIFGDQIASAGAIIIRQKGLKFRPGVNVGMGNDFTLYAEETGKVVFEQKKLARFTGEMKKTRIVSIAPLVAQTAPAAKKEAK